MSALDHLQVDTSLEELLRNIRPRLKALFARYRIPPQESEDILQQALLAVVYQHQVIHDPESWLLGILRNKCLLYWREHRRKLYETVDAAVLEMMAEPLPPAQEAADRRRDLESAIERLPERCRALLSLRYQGYETPEMAARLGYSQASISKTTKRCLAVLTRSLLTTGVLKRKAES